MKRIALILPIIIALHVPVLSANIGIDLGLRYGAGICTLGQDPFMERTGEHYTFLNFLVSGELIVKDIFRVELGLLFDERGFTQLRGDESSFQFYFIEIPLVFKLYPIKYLYLGTGVGAAFKVGDKKQDNLDISGFIRGYDNFVSQKMKDFELNYVLVLGASIPVHERVTLCAEFRHNYGLTNMNKHSNLSILLPPEDFFERFRTLYFFIGASYRVL
ncbi:MAG: hypothetical protein A2176_02175 [Spirochaetes bacterium RBG_13_51_14]|nr:MAG: hypothetical protein A2176_02175 [Spirochaetes bacterium RBG_13_51_14]